MRTAAVACVLALGPAVARAQIAHERIAHEPIGCIVAGQFPIVEARLEPASSVARARVYFQSELRPGFYFVEMVLQDGKFVARLPKVSLAATAITYYILAVLTDGWEDQTAENVARVVSDPSRCPEGGPVAAGGPPGPVNVHGTTVKETGFWPKGFGRVGAWSWTVQLGTPQKAAVTVGRLFQLQSCGSCGVLVTAEPGIGGGRLGAGLAKQWNSRVSRAAKLTLLHTWNPWLADDRKTYLGGELTTSLGILHSALTASLGAARRVSAGPGARDWIVTGGIGCGF